MFIPLLRSLTPFFDGSNISLFDFVNVVMQPSLFGLALVMSQFMIIAKIEGSSA